MTDNNISGVAAREKLWEACKSGNLESIKEVLDIKKSLPFSHRMYLEGGAMMKGAQLAAENGHINVIEKLLPELAKERMYNSPATKENLFLFAANKNKQEVMNFFIDRLDFSFSLAKSIRNLEQPVEVKNSILQLFYNRNKLSTNESEQFNANNKLFLAVAEGDKKLVDIILNGDKHQDGLIEVAQLIPAFPNNKQGYTDNSVTTNYKEEKYTSKVKANLNANEDYAFRIAASNNNIDMIRTFIFDMNIEKSEAIVNHLQNYPNKEIELLFQSRELGLISNKEIDNFMAKNGMQTQLDEQLIQACKDGNLEAVKKYLTSPELPNHAYIHANNNAALFSAVHKGHLEIVKYLTSSPELKDHADVKDGKALIVTAQRGDLEMMKYLTSSPDLKEYANIHVNNDEVLIIAAKRGNVEMMNYLLSSPDLKEVLSIYSNVEKIFDTGNIDAARFLIFDKNIMITPEVQKSLENLDKDKAEEINNMFKVRELNNKLAGKLSSPNFNITENINKMRLSDNSQEVAKLVK